MGSFWKKAGRYATAVYTGGISEYARAYDKSRGGTGYRATEYEQQRAQIADDQGNIRLDEFGYTDVTPGRRVAPEAQYASEKYIAAKNAAIRGDALHTLQGGLGLLEEYRPGGAAALTSPYYQNMAQVLMQSQLEAPDLLSEVRRHAQGTANRRARTAQYAQIGGALLTAAGAALGGPAGALVGAGAGAALQSQVKQPPPNVGDVPESAQGAPGAGFAFSQPAGGGAAPQQQQGVGGAPGGFEELGPTAPMDRDSSGTQQNPYGIQGGAGAPAGGGVGGAPTGQKQLGGGARPQQGGAQPQQGGGGQLQQQQGGAGPAAGGGGGIAPFVMSRAMATVNSPDYYSRLLAGMDELDLHAEAILYA